MFGFIKLVLVSVAIQVSITSASFPKENLFFVETFETDPFLAGTWVKSSDEKYIGQPVMVKAANSPAKGFEADLGLSLTKELQYYGFGSKFPYPFVMEDHKELVVQYELKLEESLSCGGAYVKLPRGDSDVDIFNLNSATPYSIMFGPDKCGSSNNKVHFIVQYQNPVSKEWEEKHFNDTPPVKLDKRTHLYTLLLRKDNSFEIFIDQKSMKKGNLLTHMTPAINPEREIADPTDSKPEDWVDEAKISDPEASKPDDWDELAPRTISDPNAVKPSAWLDDAPLSIPDPAAVKPVDWDDEEDGVWEAPLIDNPACEAAGCGEWQIPQIKNPAYKGLWKAPLIDNPAYKGPWAARRIPNPNYFEDLNPALHLAPLRALAVEVWTINAGIFFDNFVVTDSLEDAWAFAETSFARKQQVESHKEKKEKKEKTKQHRDEKKKSGTLKEKAEVHISEIVEVISEYTAENGWVVAGTGGALVLTLLLWLLLPTTPQPRRTSESVDTPMRTEPTETTSPTEPATEAESPKPTMPRE